MITLMNLSFTMMKYGIRVFNCTEDGRLAWDMKIECMGSDHLKWIILSIIGISAYCLALPLAGSILLYKKRWNLRLEKTLD